MHLYDSRAEKCATPFPVENRESELEADRISIGNPRRNDEQKITAIGGKVREGEGSRVVFELNGVRRYFHRPHPGKEAKKYQVEELREWFKYLEVIP